MIWRSPRRKDATKLQSSIADDVRKYTDSTEEYLEEKEISISRVDGLNEVQLMAETSLPSFPCLV
jgi:meiotically up-regulated gene 157 (Mug157) protein